MEWISHKEKVPDYGKKVICLSEEYGIVMGRRESTSKEGEKYSMELAGTNRIITYDIKYWMPLPTLLRSYKVRIKLDGFSGVIETELKARNSIEAKELIIEEARIKYGKMGVIVEVTDEVTEVLLKSKP